MSGECDFCSEHCLQCECGLRQKNMEVIKIWAQMFFEDGCVSQGMRIPAAYLDEGHELFIDRTAKALLASTGRDEGWMLLWGAGNMVFNHYPTSFSSPGSSELDSSASEP